MPMHLHPETPIAIAAARIHGAMAVFEALGIDYSCSGMRSISDAAYAEGLDPQVVIESLRGLRAVEASESWNDHSLSDLIRHLVETHHASLRDELCSIALKLADVCTCPSVETDADLVSMRTTFAGFSEVLIAHLRDEEHEVFPAIAALEERWLSGRPGPVTNGGLCGQIESVVAEHGRIQGDLRLIREIRLRLDDSNQVPEGCQPILTTLERLEAHVHESMFLENCVLFPRAVALEADLAQFGTAGTAIAVH